MAIQTKERTVLSWGRHKGKEICLFRFVNTGGAYVELTNYGASLVSAVVPDSTGLLENVLLGFNHPAGYFADSCYIGATIGRFANRIAGAQFVLDGKRVILEANDGPNSNHGGFHGFHQEVFDYTLMNDGICFNWESKDGAGGYPGTLSLQVQYQWTDASELRISYQATADKNTVANFTNHAYFNLTAGKRKIGDHSLIIYADEMLEDGPGYIPTGRVVPVGDLAFRGETINQRIGVGGSGRQGINRCYCLAGVGGLSSKPAAVLKEPVSGRKLEVSTSYPGLLLYTGDFLHSQMAGHAGLPYGALDGLCLECQYFPDSPNHSHFPSTRLHAGELYDEQISYKFSIDTNLNK